MTNNFRQPGNITGHFHGEEDHGIMTVMIYLQFSDGGGSQGFGGLALGQPGLVDDFIGSLCAAFGVRKLDQLKNAPCFALRCFDESWAQIEGLESAMTGERFVIAEWRRKHFPDAPDPLATRRAHLRSEIAFHRRRIHEMEDELAQLSKSYRPIGDAK